MKNYYPGVLSADTTDTSITFTLPANELEYLQMQADAYVESSGDVDFTGLIERPVKTVGDLARKMLRQRIGDQVTAAYERLHPQTGATTDGGYG